MMYVTDEQVIRILCVIIMLLNLWIFYMWYRDKKKEREINKFKIDYEIEIGTLLTEAIKLKLEKKKLQEAGEIPIINKEAEKVVTSGYLRTDIPDAGNYKYMPMFALCPVCSGVGKVHWTFYNVYTPNANTTGATESNIELVKCRSCKGRGYIK